MQEKISIIRIGTGVCRLEIQTQTAMRRDIIHRNRIVWRDGVKETHKAHNLEISVRVRFSQPTYQ